MPEIRAKWSIACAQGVVNEEIYQIFYNKTKQAENIASVPAQLNDYLQNQIVAPTAAYFSETLAQHFSGLTPNISQVRPTSMQASTLVCKATFMHCCSPD